MDLYALNTIKTLIKFETKQFFREVFILEVIATHTIRKTIENCDVFFNNLFNLEVHYKHCTNLFLNDLILITKALTLG